MVLMTWGLMAMVWLFTYSCSHITWRLGKLAAVIGGWWSQHDAAGMYSQAEQFSGCYDEERYTGWNSCL
jgi:hypothetical protein